MTPIPSEPTTEAEQGGGPEGEPTGTAPTMQRTWSWQRRPELERTHSITSVMTESHYAVLPHGISLDDWSEEDKEALDDHVRHMMHSKRSKFKYSMIAFGKYIRKRKWDSGLPDLAAVRLHLTSTWILCHLIRYLDHTFWPGLGVVLDW